MTSSIKLFAPHKITLSFLVLLLAHQLSHGQAFTGPNVVEPNSTHTYYFDDGAYYYPNEWLIDGGTLTGSGQNGTQYHVNIKWGEVPGYAMVTFKSGMMLLGGMSVTINSTVPDAPPAPTVANHPGYTRLTRGNPPNGEVWYWQDGPSGTSTLNSSPFVDRTFGTEYYIKSYKSSVDQWSPVTMVNYTVSAISAPPMPIVTNYPGYTRLTRGNPPAGEIWYWQDTPSGMDTLDSSAHVDRSLGTKYYLRSHVAAIDQWGPTTTIDYSVDPQFQGLSDENYIHTIVPRTGTTDVSTLADNEKMESVTYFDGLGRPMQSVGIRAGAGQEDIITHVGYDNYGRQSKEYLPYSSQTSIGSFRTAALSATNSYYDAARYETDFLGMTIADINPYSEKELESSPLNRVLKQAAPGHDWRLGGGHEIEFEYTANTFDPNSPTDPANDNVRLYRVELAYADKTYTPSLSLNPGALGYYGQGELYKTVTRDENWTNGKAHTSEEFTDKQGRVVLKRTYGDSKVGSVIVPNAPHDTYYVYDDYGNLTYVLPPKIEASTAPLTTVNAQLDELGYHYTYDHRNRLVEKKIPGKGREYIVYNKLDQPILTQDASLRAQDKWLFTKYDAFGRVAYTGEMTRDIGRAALQDDADLRNSQFVTKQTTATTMVGDTIYYNNESYPVDHITDILTINYYDNYNFDVKEGVYSGSYGINPITNAKGLQTGSKVKILEIDSLITTVTYYDGKSRPIYIYSNNPYLETTDKIKSKLDFLGNVEESMASHKKADQDSIITTDTYTYDHVGRLLSQKQKINAQPEELIVLNRYDDLGQLENKKVGGTVAANIENSVGLQSVDYTYNIRGWLKQINDPSAMGNNLFAFKINYNTNDHGGTNLFNGNISETEWRTANDDMSTRWYKYNYDALNRITSGIIGSSNPSWNNKHNLKLVEYDKNGNITKLGRNGYLTNGTFTDYLDDLTYTYDVGNKLIDILEEGDKNGGFSDALSTQTGDYAYDANGNMTSDANKGISAIAYNYLNLPRSLSFGNGNISYIYDATGNKLEKKVTEGSMITRTYYAGNYVYQGSSLKFFHQPEGYVDAENGFEYVYQYKDHLGNIRLSYKDENQNNRNPVNLIILEENNYYPFGLEHKGYNNNVSANSNSVASKFKYNGVEHEEALGLDLYEMPLRQYDPAIARWTTIDPVIHYSNSTYNGYDNNPIFWADPSGAAVESIAGGTRYTGADAQNMFRQLRNESAGQEVKDWYLDISTGGLTQTRNKHSFWIGTDQLSTDDILSELDNLGIEACFCKGKNGVNQIHADTEGIYNAYREAEVAENLALTKDLVKDYAIVFGGNILFPAGRVPLRSPASFNPRFPVSGGGISSFSEASTYGIKSYKDLIKLVKGKGLQAHHLIEQRFASLLGRTPGSMEAIALTKVEHQVFTNAWRARIGYNGSNAAVTTSTATRAQVEGAAREIYKNYPEILKVLGL